MKFGPQSPKVIRRKIPVTIIVLGCVFFFIFAISPYYRMEVDEEPEVAAMPFLQEIGQCNCSRPYFYPPKSNQVLQSSCSDEGTFHESRQKVVTFTLHFPWKMDTKREKLYKEGIFVNLKRMRKYYPGYSMRLYTDVPLEGDYCRLMCANSDLFWCDMSRTPLLGNMTGMYFRSWRFLTLADPTVVMFLSRDLDSAIIKREAGAVWDWLGLNKAIYVMRDFLGDHDIPILAGMWGARNDLLGPNLATKLRDQIVRMSLRVTKYKTTDQKILNEVIYYPLKNQIVSYDPYHCQRYGKETMQRPIPVRRKNNSTDFVGNLDLGRYKVKVAICPKDCRPSYGQDWQFC